MKRGTNHPKNAVPDVEEGPGNDAGDFNIIRNKAISEEDSEDQCRSKEDGALASIIDDQEFAIEQWTKDEMPPRRPLRLEPLPGVPQ